jgi:hypothetical protein
MGRPKREQKMVTGMAWYRPDQWALLRQVSSDSGDIEETYQEWERTAKQKLEELRRMGLRIEKIDVDVEEMVNWCKSLNLKIDGSSRARFAAEKIRLKYTARK